MAPSPDGTDPFGRFMKVQEVAASLSRVVVYRLIHEQPDPFPAPIKIGTASVWAEREVVAWKARRVESRRI
jgi:predicted DNA-binding transcriptional regulator AlpA